MRLPVAPRGPIDNDTLDELAREAAHVVLVGGATRDSGYRFLAELLYLTPIPEQVASGTFRQSKPVRGRQTVTDLASRLRALMVNKVLPDEGGRSRVDLLRIAQGASFAGFVRKFLTTASQSEFRNLGYEYRAARVVAYDEDNPAPEPVPSVSAEDTYFGSHFEDAASRYAARAHACRPMERLQVQARTLAAAFSLPPVDAPSTQDERAEVLEELERDHRAAYRVVSAMSRGDLVEGVLSGLFSSWDDDHLETVAELDPRVAELIARAAVSAVPPVSQRVARMLERRFCAGLEATQHELAAGVVRAWVHASSTMIGDEFAGWVVKPDEQVAAEAAEFTRCATRLLRSGFAGFGSPDEISEWLFACSEEILSGQQEPQSGVETGGGGAGSGLVLVGGVSVHAQDG